MTLKLGVCAGERPPQAATERHRILDKCALLTLCLGSPDVRKTDRTAERRVDLERGGRNWPAPDLHQEERSIEAR